MHPCRLQLDVELLEHGKPGVAASRCGPELIGQPSDANTQGRHIALKPLRYSRERRRTGLDGDVARQGSGSRGQPVLTNGGQLGLRERIGLTDPSALLLFLFLKIIVNNNCC